MRTLTSEILIRYQEMAEIMERVLGTEGLRDRSTGPGASFGLYLKEGVPSGASIQPAAKSSYVCVEFSGGCYEEPPGWCRTGGCTR